MESPGNDRRVRELRNGSKASERVSVEGPCFPRCLVPGLLAADHLDRHDDAITSELVGRGDSVVEFPGGIELEFDRPRQVTDDQRLHLVVAGIVGQRKIGIIPLALGWSCRINSKELAIRKAPLVLLRVPIRWTIAGGCAPGNVLAFVIQVGFDLCRVAAIPKANMQERLIHMTAVSLEEDVTDRDSPIIVRIKLTRGPMIIGAGSGRRGILLHLGLSGEQGQVRARKLVAEAYGKPDRARINDGLVVGNSIATTLRLPPTTLCG